MYSIALVLTGGFVTQLRSRHRRPVRRDECVSISRYLTRKHISVSLFHLLIVRPSSTYCRSDWLGKDEHDRLEGGRECITMYRGREEEGATIGGGREGTAIRRVRGREGTDNQMTRRQSNGLAATRQSNDEEAGLHQHDHQMTRRLARI